MIGVTVGVGSYLPLARQAAESMARHTGLECVILTDEHYERAGLQGQPPHLLKLFIWDFVDAEEVLWFDADTLCLQPWDPTALADEHAVVAVRDWIWREGIQQEARQAAVPLDEYFLTSVMLLNRRTHEPMLQLARSIYPQINSKVFEQTALNAARSRLGIPIQFLDRRYNWSLFGDGDFHEQSGCVVAHFNHPVMRQDPSSTTKFAPEAEGQIDASAFSRLGDRFHRYVRIGYDERPVYFRADGTIGEGCGSAERFWYVRQTGERPVLVIGSETSRTCELILGENQEWHGSWLGYERMPILLAPHHGQMLVDLLDCRSSNKELRGAEIGVFRGHTSALLLHVLPQLTLWMVDTWRSPRPGEHLWDDPHLRLITAEQMAAALASSLSSTEFASQRRFVVIADLTAAAACVPDQSLDFVFLDADHSLAGTFEALQVWSAKVVPGGIVAGHDLDYPDYPGVRQAVEQFCTEHHLSWQSAADYVWWFMKPLSSLCHSEHEVAPADELAIPDRSDFTTEIDTQPAKSLEASTFTEMGDRYYRYLRVGHDERPLYFRADGTIGAGGGGAEQFWDIRQTPEGMLLTISSETSTTCRLSATARNQWEGSWLSHEQMPILLTPHRGQVLLDLLGDQTKPWRGAEVGVFEGHTSTLLLQALPQLKLLMVDAWSSPAASDRLFEDPYMRQVSASQMLTALNSSINRTDFARERRTIVIADLVSASNCVQDQSLDFVFLDADHSKAGTLDALYAWSRKVVPGGIVAGHDLDHPDFPGVREAVEEFTEDRKLSWQSGADFVWWFEVPRSSPGTSAPNPVSAHVAVELAWK